jgi:methylphosphotriester-DNA--protein-cysteine methyltransferase
LKVVGKVNKKVLLSFLIISFILTNSVFAASSYYVGSAKSDVYHYPSCYWAGEIYPSNLISFDTPEDAIDAGYRPCKVCSPPLSSSSSSPTSEEIDSDDDGLTDNAELTEHFTDPLESDTDSDGLSDYSEIEIYSTDPLESDTDGDGLNDYSEVSNYYTDPLDTDTDNDELTDYTEIETYSTDPLDSDTDSDGLNDYSEIFEYYTDPLDSDTDKDGLNDYSEIIDSSTTESDTYTESYYVGSTKSDVYHYPSCYWAEEIYPSNLISFDTPEDATNAGYRPCKVCSPPLPSFISTPTSEDTDSDEDGLSDSAELTKYFTDPFDTDTDNDELSDYLEIETYSTNPLDSDGDKDGLSDYSEIFEHYTDPLETDTDNDGLNDYSEIFENSTTVVDSNTDSDDDGLNDNSELTEYYTDPFDSDTDNDGLSDHSEIETYYTDPFDSDTDSDGLNDYSEIFNYYTDPLDNDTDNDELTDYSEIFDYYTDPLDSDTDNDGLNDYSEIFDSTATQSDTYTDSNYVGSAKSDVYHYPSCYWAGEIYPSNLISFDTPEDAIDAGYRPCKVCNPPLSSSIPTTLEETSSDDEELIDNTEIYTNSTYSVNNDTVLKSSKDYSIPDNSNNSQKNGIQQRDKPGDVSTSYSDSTDPSVSVTDDVEPISTYFKQLKNYTEDFEPILALKFLFKLILIVGFVKYFKAK